MRYRNNFFNDILIALISLLRPFLGPAQCRFHQGCTAYAIEQLQTKSLRHAFLHISKRLLICNPLKKVI